MPRSGVVPPMAAESDKREMSFLEHLEELRVRHLGRKAELTTILRGKVIVADGKLHGTLNDGQLVKRRIAGDVLSRPVA